MVILALCIVIHFLAMLHVLRCHHDEHDSLCLEEVRKVVPVMACWFEAYYYFLCAIHPYESLHPSLKRFVSLCIIAKLEGLRAVLDPAVVEHPCVMVLASNINSNHQCLFGHLLELLILCIMHFGTLQSFESRCSRPRDQRFNSTVGYFPLQPGLLLSGHLHLTGSS